MTDQGDQLAVYGSLRDILRAIDQDDDGFPDDSRLVPATGAGSAGLSAVSTRGSTALVSRIERLPATGGRKFDDDIGGPKWRDRIGSWVPGTAFAMAIPVMGTLFAGSLLIAPVPNAEWAGAALNEVWLEEVAPAPFTLAASAEVNHRDTGIQAFAMLGQRALSAIAGEQPKALAAYGLTAEPVVEVRPGETVKLPFRISSTDLPAGTELIIRGVPENAALSSAEPKADGHWAVPIDKVSEVKLTAYALPTLQSHELVAELRAQSGELLARATTKLVSTAAPSTAPAVAAVQQQQRPSIKTPDWATITAQPEVPQALGIQDPSQSAEPAGSEQKTEMPEWMQPWNRSALGGAR